MWDRLTNAQMGGMHVEKGKGYNHVRAADAMPSHHNFGSYILMPMMPFSDMLDKHSFDFFYYAYKLYVCFCNICLHNEDDCCI